MTNNLGIKIVGTADLSAVERDVNKLGQTTAQLNKVQFNPISMKGMQDLAQYEQRVQQLVLMSKSLQGRLTKTGQLGKSLHQWNWDDLYADPQQRRRVMMDSVRYTLGDRFAAPPAPPPAPSGKPNVTPGGRPPPPPAPPRPGDGSWTGAGAQVAQAGLRAAGPAGGVAANALGTGMAGGLGAGLMGLFGGIAALGVGKLVGAVMEKLDQAEQNNVDYDRLKRIVGDVGISFGTLKTTVQASADQLKIQYGEASKLSTQFAKLSNLTSDQVNELPEELKTGVGMARAFGMDPSQTMGVMGQMRGVGVTRDPNESRRFALLLGEAIGKAGAFAKADEAMEAIAGFANMQTRAGMAPANVAGYAGMLSGLAGSGIPGLDIGGSASLLARVNASLSAGGAKGEASQFFTGGIGASLGLNPYQTRMWREQGAFGTLGQSFGEGSVYARYKGRAGPGGNTTLLSATLEKLRGQYVDGSDELADAAANHLGIGVNQAMALLSVKPNQMGEMQAYAKDLTKLSGSGILNMSKALYGSAGDRSALASEFLGRTGSDAIGADDAKAIRAAQAGGNDDELKRVLASVASKYDQEKTLGSDIRDSKNLLDNLKTAMADKLVPLTQDIRAGVLHLAGKGEKTGDEVLRDIANMEHKDRKGRISNIASADRARINADIEKRMGEVAPGISPGDIFKQDWHQEYAKKLKDGTATPEEKAAFEKRVGEYQAARLKGIDDPEVIKKKRELQEERARLLAEVNKKERTDLDAEGENLKKRLREIGTQPLGAPPPGTLAPLVTGGGRGFVNPVLPGSDAGRRDFDPMTGMGRMPKGLGALSKDPDFQAQIAANEREIGAPKGLLRAQIEQESRFHPGAISPVGAMGLAQVMPKTLAEISRRAGRSLDPMNPQDALLIQKEVMKENYARFGNWDDATSAYNGGWNKNRWGNRETAAYTPSIAGIMRRNEVNDGMRMPEGTASTGTGLRMPGFNVSSDDITVRVVNERGEPIAPPQSIQTRVSAANAGAAR